MEKRDNMKVGIFTETYLPDINGVVTSVVSLKKALEMHGHEVYIVTNHDNVLKTTFDEKERILRLPGLKLEFLYGYKISSPIQVQATKAIKDWGLDVIHIQQEFGIGIYGRYLASTWEIPLLNTYHTTYEDYTHYVNFFDLEVVDHLSKKVVEVLSKSFTKKSNIVITPSQKTKDMLLGYGIEKQIEVIPTGLDLDRFDISKTDDQTKHDIKAKYHIANDQTLFTYVGRIAKEKSVDVLIDAFKIVKDNNVKAKLLIVGGGPDLEDLKKQAKKLDVLDYVFFEGLVPSDNVPMYYHTADAFISASTTETQGLTYIEALASGLGIFAVRDEVLEGIVIDGKTGYYFDDHVDLAKKIEMFSNDKDAKSRIFNNALEVSKQYSLDVYYEHIINCYREAIEIENNEKNFFD